MLCVLRIRLRKGVHKRLNDDQPDYYFLSPIPSDKLELGDWVLCETRKRDFAAGKIIEIFSEEDSLKVIKKVMPRSFVICRLPNSFDDRCAHIKGMKLRQEVYYTRLNERRKERKKALKEAKRKAAEEKKKSEDTTTLVE